MRAFTCPRASAARRPSSPCTANGFIFHWAAETARRRHFITVTRGGAATGWHRGPGMDKHPELPFVSLCWACEQLVPYRQAVLSAGARFWKSLNGGGLRLFLKCWERVNEPWIRAYSDAALGWQNRWQDSRRQSSLNLLYTKSAFDIPWQQSLICTRSSKRKKKKQLCRRLWSGNALCSPSTWHSGWQEGLGMKLEGSQLTWACLLLIKQKCQSRNNSSCVPPFF